MLFGASFCKVLTCLSLFGPGLVLGLPMRPQHDDLQVNTTPYLVEKRAYGSICNIPLRNTHQKYCHKNVKYFFDDATGKFASRPLSETETRASIVPKGTQCGELKRKESVLLC
jgi:hypothetical protein